MVTLNAAEIARRSSNGTSANATLRCSVSAAFSRVRGAPSYCSGFTVSAWCGLVPVSMWRTEPAAVPNADFTATGANLAVTRRPTAVLAATSSITSHTLAAAPGVRGPGALRSRRKLRTWIDSHQFGQQ